jgi:hypothetical protein
MPFGARPAWLVGRKARVGRFGQRECIDDFEAERRAPVAAVAGPIRRAFEPVGVAFLPGEDVRLRSGALFELGGESARIHARQTRRSRAA